MGGYWDKSCSTVTQLKEGLNRILCLIPYNVISQPLWECFMPEWLEAIRTEVPDQQLKEFREVLRYDSRHLSSVSNNTCYHSDPGSVSIVSICSVRNFISVCLLTCHAHTHTQSHTHTHAHTHTHTQFIFLFFIQLIFSEMRGLFLRRHRFII